MIDVMIPLGKGSTWQNSELRYCLRAIEKHLKGYRDIYIVGEKPSWLQNVVHIPAKDEDLLKSKAKNIYNKINLYINRTETTEDFIFFNDDHFLLADVEATNFPYHHKGYLADGKQSSKYQLYKDNTKRELESRGLRTLNFDTHSPIVYNKAKFQELAAYDFSKPFCYIIKSLYCNHHGIEGDYYTDLKIDARLTKQQIEESIKGRLYFSIGEYGVTQGLYDVMELLYQKKSKYEA